MSKNCKRLKIYHQKITPQGRKKWRRITRRQQEWMLKALRYLYAEEVTATHKPLKSAKRKIIIDTLFEKVRARRIFISKSEVSRIADDKMRKWNKNMMKGEQKRTKVFSGRSYDAAEE